jgi:glycosyltransferase involved in cell wall biosynthesis
MHEKITSSANKDCFDVLLPCYNAAAWIDKVVENLLTLQGPTWRLIARDDGSTDNTLDLLKKWRDALGPRVLLLDDTSPRNLGWEGNYNALLAASTAPWVLMADPDDVWLPNRVEVTLSALRTAELSVGVGTPVAVCTDAIVVDGTLSMMAPSYWQWSRTRPLAQPRISRQAMDSVALGSTMALNRALIEKALPLKAGAAGPDWWLALVAVAFGRFVAVPEATIQYRRHGGNSTQDPFSVTLAGALSRYANAPASLRNRLNFLIDQAARQAQEFLDRFGDELHREDVDRLRGLADLSKMGPMKRRATIITRGLWFNSPMKNVGLLLFV